MESQGLNTDGSTIFMDARRSKMNKINQHCMYYMSHTTANTKNEHIKDLQMFDMNYAPAIERDKR